jgi:transcriptional regulator with XRE-family HTH domain
MDETVKQNLVKFREEAGLTQADAAELSGVPVDNLRRYESGGTRNVPGTVLAALAKAYGHAVDDFFLDEPPPARLEEAPTIFLRTRPNVEVPAEKMRALQEQVDRVNREIRHRRKK